MAINHATVNINVDDRYLKQHFNAVLWSLDDLPELAADIHRTVLALVVHGAPCADVDAAIIGCLRGTTPRAADGVAEPAGHG